MWKPERLLTFFLTITLFIIMPLVFSYRLQDVEQSPRFLCMAVIVTISSLISFFFVYKKSISLKSDRIYFIISLFLFINFISFLRCINYGDGLFEFLKIFLFVSLLFQFILVLTYDEKYKLIFYKTVTISALIFIVFGILQLFPAVEKMLSKGSALKIDYSIASSLGNKNFFAETLLLMLPLSFLTILTHRKLWRIIAIVVSLLSLITIILLQTLSTWVAIAVAVMVLILLLFRFRKKIFVNTQSYKTFYLGVISICIAFAIAVVVYIKLAGTSQIRERITAINLLLNSDEDIPEASAQNSIYERIIMWNNSVKLIADHPFVGVGLGNWKIFSPAYGSGTATYMTTGVIRFVHPHNEFLLVLSESGIIGFILMLSWLILLFAYAWRIAKNAEDSGQLYFGLALIFALTVYVLISLVSLPTSRIYPSLLFMLFTALIVAGNEKSVQRATILNTRLILFIMALSLFSAVGTIAIASKRLKSDLELSQALLIERKRNYEAMKKYLEKIDKKYFPLDATATPIAWYQGFANFYLGNRDAAFGLFKEAEKVNPNHLMVLNDLGTCYNLNGDARTAEAYYQKALTIQPAFGDALVNLAIIYFNSGKVDEAYNTLIQYRGKIKPESVQVFSTIMVAKASTVTSDEIALERFRKRTLKAPHLILLLKDLKMKNQNLSAVIGESTKTVGK